MIARKAGPNKTPKIGGGENPPIALRIAIMAQAGARTMNSITKKPRLVGAFTSRQTTDPNKPTLIPKNTIVNKFKHGRSTSAPVTPPLNKKKRDHRKDSQKTQDKLQAAGNQLAQQHFSETLRSKQQQSERLLASLSADRVRDSENAAKAKQDHRHQAGSY